MTEGEVSHILQQQFGIDIIEIGVADLNQRPGDLGEQHFGRVRLLRRAEQTTPDIPGSIYSLGSIDYVNLVMQNDEVSN